MLCCRRTWRYAISVWRGIPITGNKADLVAVLRNADGREAARFTRTVHFASNPARIEMLPAQSKLVADGSTRPVVALRITDRYGRPVHAGLLRCRSGEPGQRGGDRGRT